MTSERSDWSDAIVIQCLQSVELSFQTLGKKTEGNFSKKSCFVRC